MNVSYVADYVNVRCNVRGWWDVYVTRIRGIRSNISHLAVGTNAHYSIFGTSGNLLKALHVFERLGAIGDSRHIFERCQVSKYVCVDSESIFRPSLRSRAPSAWNFLSCNSQNASLLKRLVAVTFEILPWLFTSNVTFLVVFCNLYASPTTFSCSFRSASSVYGTLSETISVNPTVSRGFVDLTPYGPVSAFTVSAMKLAATSAAVNLIVLVL